MSRLTALSAGVLLGMATSGCAQKVEAPLPATAVSKPALTDHERSVARNIFCKGEPVIVQDQNSALTISDNCRSVTIAGSNNKVTVNIQSHGSIKVTGSGNEVIWHMADIGAPPVVVNGGSGNKVDQLRNEIGAP